MIGIFIGCVFYTKEFFIFNSKARSNDISSTNSLSFVWGELQFREMEMLRTNLVFSSLDHLPELVEADLVVAGGITGAEDAVGLDLVHVLHHLKY